MGRGDGRVEEGCTLDTLELNDPPLESRELPQQESAPPSIQFCATPLSLFLSLPRAIISMLYIVGLGLADEQDITLRGLEAVRSCERVYLEAYTSILMVEDYQQRLVRVSP